MNNSTEHREDLGLELGTEPGIFSLPTPEHFDSGRVASNLEGASRTTWDELEDSSQDFPMIVWLRGDEPWFTQFDMDAEAVMTALGIKRSRLTQISGKDLRVGRVRMDRYIRPVYRSIDVEQYLKWTRATASHQKSSDAIKMAVDQLQLQSESIQTTLTNLSTSFAESLKAEMSAFIGTSVSDGLMPLARDLDSFKQNMEQAVANTQSAVTLMATAFGETTATLKQTISDYAAHQSAAIEALTLQLHQISEKTAAMEERLNAWDNMLSTNLESLAADLAMLKKPRQFEKAMTRKPKHQKLAAADEVKPRLAVRAAPSRRKTKFK